MDQLSTCMHLPETFRCMAAALETKQRGREREELAANPHQGPVSVWIHLYSSSRGPTSSPHPLISPHLPSSPQPSNPTQPNPTEPNRSQSAEDHGIEPSAGRQVGRPLALRGVLQASASQVTRGFSVGVTLPTIVEPDVLGLENNMQWLKKPEFQNELP